MTRTPFIHDDFLLRNETARTLYHGYAETMPILDYHCHLPPQDVAEDRRWENLAQLWLGGDHYKWRLLRANGVEERFITGDAPDWEKFEAFAATMPYLLRNPMYDWSHLELARYFGITDLLSPGTARAIWDRVNPQLATPACSARGLMTRSRVRVVCTTDDPTATLDHHRKVARDGFAVQMLPTWRPDKALAIERTSFWNTWLDALEVAAGAGIRTWDDFLCALQRRHDDFAAAGCRLSDYGLETVCAAPYTDAEARAIFAKARGGAAVSAGETEQFRSAVLFECGRMDAAAGWTWQIHYGALRNTNTRMFERIGPDTGFDSIGDWPVAQAMARLFDRLDRLDALPQTVVYTLNPRDNELLGAMIGNFQRGPTAGKMQFGSGWWFNDQRDGMLRQLEALSQLGLLSRFIGMLTDSRSFLSYTRHEYFRRILCDLLGSDIESGRIPGDIEWVGGMVRDICARNAARYFGFQLDDA